jgi:acyl-homoserine lactone acylase PvdQ
LRVSGFLRHPSNWSRAAGGAAARLIERGDAALKWFNGDLRGEIAAAARTAVERVRLRHGSGPVDWRWGKAHRAYWRHPLSGSGQTSFDSGRAPVDGCPYCLRNTGTGQPTFSAASGAEYRLIVDLAEPDRFWLYKTSATRANRIVRITRISSKPGGPVNTTS